MELVELFITVSITAVADLREQKYQFTLKYNRMKTFRIIYTAAIVGYTLLAVVLLTTACNTDKQQTTIEEVESINKRIGGQDDILKQFYESEINSLKRDNEQLKNEIVRKDSIIERCMVLSEMVMEHYR